MCVCGGEGGCGFVWREKQEDVCVEEREGVCGIINSSRVHHIRVNVGMGGREWLIRYTMSCYNF